MADTAEQSRLRKFLEAIGGGKTAEDIKKDDQELLPLCGQGEQKVDRQGRPIPCRKS